MKRTTTALRPVRKRRKLTRKEIQLYSLCALPLLWVFIFSYIPMGGIIIAFKDYKYSMGIFGSPWVGLRYFEAFFNSSEFSTIVWNTLSLNFTFIICNLASAVALAILLFELRSRAKTKVYQTILITPHFLSWVVVAYMAYAFLNPNYGLINRIIGAFGGDAVDWYSKPDAWPAILTIASVWKHIGMKSVIYYASLMGIDNSLFEAADIDGATKWQKIRYIVIPLLVPLMTILTILDIGNIFRADFGLFYQLTRNVGTLYSTTDVMDTYIFRTMRVVGDMGMSSAAGLLQSVVGFVLVMITNYVSKKIDSDNALF